MKRKNSGLAKARAALRAKYGTDNIGKINQMKKRGGSKRRGNPIEKPKSKSKRAKRANPAPAATPVAANPTESTVKANRRRKKKHHRRHARGQGPKVRAERARNRRRRRKKNPAAATTKSNPVQANRKRRHKRRRHHNLVGRGERRQYAKHRNKHRGHVSGYSRKSRVKGHTRRTNPVSGLMGNPGPYTGRNLTNFGIIGVGLGLGLFGADVIDRIVATMKPKGGNYPWYGRAAAAAQLSRPTPIRLGAQAATALAAMGAAYITRRVRYIPWLFSGIAFGAAATLVKMGIQWWGAPLIFPVKDPTQPSFNNRLFVIEQKDVQDVVSGLFTNWQQSLSLSAAQQTPPVVTGVLTGATTSVYTLGGLDPRDIIEIVGKSNGHGNRLAGPQFRADGTLGTCPDCAATGGHLTTCKRYCPNCEGAFGYEVQKQDNLLEYARLAGVDPNYVAAMNGNKAVHAMRPGERVKLPYLIGQKMKELFGDRLERHPANMVDTVGEPPQRAAGQDFVMPESVLDPAE